MKNIKMTRSFLLACAIPMAMSPLATSLASATGNGVVTNQEQKAFKVLQYKADLGNFSTIEEAIAEAKKWASSRIEDEGKVVWEFGDHKYKVYQGSKLLEEFGSMEDAVAEAKKWAYSKIKHNREMVWAFEDLYRVFQGKTGLGSFGDMASAEAEAKKWAGSTIEQKGKVVWRFGDHKYKVYQGSKLLKECNSVEEAIEEAKKWANSKVGHKDRIIWNFGDHKYNVYQGKKLLKQFNSLDEAVIEARKWANSKVEHKKATVWNFNDFYRVYQGKISLGEFSNLTDAEKEAKKWAGSVIYKAGEQIWKFEEKGKYKVEQFGKNLGEFDNLEDAIAEAKKWANSTVSKGDTVNWRFNSLFRVFQGMIGLGDFETVDKAIAEAKKWSDSIVRQGEKIVWRFTPKYEEEEKEESCSVKSINALGDIDVEFGTAIGSAGLPSKVTVVLDNGNEAMVPVAWNTASYNANVAGTYAIEGAIDVSGIENISDTDLKAKVNVIVAKEAVVVTKPCVEEFYVTGAKAVNVDSENKLINVDYNREDLIGDIGVRFNGDVKIESVEASGMAMTAEQIQGLIGQNLSADITGFNSEVESTKPVPYKFKELTSKLNGDIDINLINGHGNRETYTVKLNDCTKPVIVESSCPVGEKNVITVPYDETTEIGDVSVKFSEKVKVEYVKFNGTMINAEQTAKIMEKTGADLYGFNEKICTTMPIKTKVKDVAEIANGDIEFILLSEYGNRTTYTIRFVNETKPVIVESSCPVGENNTIKVPYDETTEIGDVSVKFNEEVKVEYVKFNGTMINAEQTAKIMEKTGANMYGFNKEISTITPIKTKVKDVVEIAKGDIEFILLNKAGNRTTYTIEFVNETKPAIVESSCPVGENNIINVPYDDTTEIGDVSVKFNGKVKVEYVKFNGTTISAEQTAMIMEKTGADLYGFNEKICTTTAIKTKVKDVAEMANGDVELILLNEAGNRTTYTIKFVKNV